MVIKENTYVLDIIFLVKYCKIRAVKLRIVGAHQSRWHDESKNSFSASQFDSLVVIVDRLAKGYIDVALTYNC